MKGTEQERTVELQPPNVSILKKRGEKTGQAKETEGKWVKEFEIALLEAVESRTVKQTVTHLVDCFPYSL